MGIINDYTSKKNISENLFKLFIRKNKDSELDKKSINYTLLDIEDNCITSYDNYNLVVNQDVTNLIKLLDDRYVESKYVKNIKIDKSLIKNSKDNNYIVLNDEVINKYNNMEGTKHKHVPTEIITDNHVNISDIDTTIINEILRRKKDLYRLLNDRGVKVLTTDTFKDLCNKVIELNVQTAFIKMLDFNYEYKNDGTCNLIINPLNSNITEISLENSDWFENNGNEFKELIPGNIYSIKGKDKRGLIYKNSIKIPIKE